MNLTFVLCFSRWYSSSVYKKFNKRSYTGKDRIYVREGKPVGGDEKMLQPRKVYLSHDYTPDKVEVAAWINDQPLDINNADQRIDNDPKIGHQYHVSISKYTNDKMGIEIIISVYSVCLVINNMDYYIDVIEKDKNLQGVDSDDFTHVPIYPTMVMRWNLMTKIFLKI